MPKFILLFTIAACIGAIAVHIYVHVPVYAPVLVTGEQKSTSTTASNEKGEVTLLYGDVTLSVGERASVEQVRITPLSVEEDSRCPSAVQCISAGTVKVKVETVSGMGTSTRTLSLGESMTTEAELITFVSASPQAALGEHLPGSVYSLTFNISKRDGLETLQPISEGSETACYVGGCSSQLCTDSPDTASTCEYREAYACYRTAVCEMQKSGECGWTESPQLSACIAEANSPNMLQER